MKDLTPFFSGPVRSRSGAPMRRSNLPNHYRFVFVNRISTGYDLPRPAGETNEPLDGPW